ncbi:Uncharacterized protein OBRU01_10533 [Operophtera brumata]|uniref:Telomere length and silencing protein 1 homolog n=1 Tax=Operophtera brumata TaxID=104452 RepID=A0A0L7L7W5_OPEBR|nr:Uncharacterized protein OBRU01_10533 [Operophtera brumata]
MDLAESDEITEEIKFKTRKKKNLRQRFKDDEESDDEHLKAKLEETKEIQKLRERPNGVSVMALATGQKVNIEDDITCKDPYKVKAGGMVNMQALKSGKVKQYLSPEEAALLSLPDHLRVSSTHRSEEMLSNQMLSGIPEVDLGIDAKIKNIEATEEAKMKLLWERHNKKDGPSQFVPTNMAVNFVQHNRFNMDADSSKKRKVEKPPPIKAKPASVIDDSVDKIVKKAKGERATDDFHYERFKKQFRRY